MRVTRVVSVSKGARRSVFMVRRSCMRKCMEYESGGARGMLLVLLLALKTGDA